MTLLVGAGLFIRTLVKLYSVDTGVRTGGVFVFNVLAKHHFPAARVVEIQTAIVDRLRSLPGVTFASAADHIPLSGGYSTQKIKVEGYTFRPGEDDSVAFNPIAGKYFAVTGTPLLLGRDFNERDAAGSPPVAIVNQSFVRVFFGGQAPLGRHVTSSGNRRGREGREVREPAPGRGEHSVRSLVAAGRLGTVESNAADGVFVHGTGGERRPDATGAAGGTRPFGDRSDDAHVVPANL
jgi:hypothetical protein